MKKVALRIFIVIVCLAMFATPGAGAAKPAQTPSADPPEQVLIRGQVIDAPADVRVQAVGANGELASETYAGPRGQFKFEPLPPGEYHLQVLDARGHRLALTGDSQTDVQGGGQAGRFEVVLRLAVPAVPQVGPPPVNARAAGTGQITGTVTAAAGGALLQSVSVYAYTSKTAALYDYAAYDYTGADGTYALTGLADGSYYLRFEKTDYLTSYYNGRSSLAEADAVSVTLGGVTGNINAALTLGGKITGTVTAAVGGALLEDVTVYAYTSKTAATYDYVAYDYTGADGKYALTGLATGTYYLRFAKTDYFTSYYNAKATLAEADGVSVTLGVETGSINAALVLGGKITGTVTAAAGGALLQDVTVYAYTSKTAATYDYVAYDYTGADGVYSLTGLTAGTYYLRFEKTDYLVSYYNAKASLAEADGVSVTLGGVTGSINAALVLGGKITGTVTAAAGGALLDSVTVYAYTNKTAATYDYAAYDYTGADGVYSLSGLTAGTYYLRFAKTDYLPSYYNGRANLAEADGVSVTLGGVTGNINAALAVGGRISGHVTAEGTGTALKDVQVTIYNYIRVCGVLQLNYVASDTTDAAGDYTVTGLATGNYLAHFGPLSNGSSAAYLDEYYNDKASSSSATTIGVTAGQTSGAIDAALTKGGTITGQVTAADGGAPLEEVYVDVYTSQGGWVDDTETDAAGAYSITALPAGSYKVQFYPSLAGPSIAYIEEYYNDKATLSLGDTVNVGAGAVVSGINAVLARGGQFTGQVTAADGGALLQGVEVVVYDNLGYRKGSATTSASGVYTTTGFRPGSYRLEFAPSYGNSVDYLSEFYNDKASMTSADAITLSGPGLTTANAVLARGGSISGTVTSSITGAPLEDVDVSILDVDGYEFEWIYTDVNGQYLARGLPTGVYHAHFSISYCSLRYQIYYNQKTTLAAADHISVTAPGLVPNINGQLPVPATINISQCFLPMVKR